MESALTEKAGHTRISNIAGLQVHFVGVKSGRCNSQVTAEPVDVLDQCYIHLQAPFATGLLGMSSVYAGAPRVIANAGCFMDK